MGIWTRLQSFIFGGAVATAAADGIRAVLEVVRQHAWQRNPVRVLDPGTAARLHAQGLISPSVAHEEASREGYNPERVDALTQLALRAPDVGELIQLIRRGYPSPTQVEHALRKAQFEPEWDAMIRALVQAPLAPGELSTAIHRGIMHGPDLIITEPPAKPGKVPIVPPSTIDPVEQAKWWGLDHEQLRVLVGITGLPLSLGEMLQLLNRGVVTTDDVQRAVAESNLRNEYMDVALALRRQLLTPREWAEAELRGVKTRPVAEQGAAMHGLEADDYVTLFETVGRPLPVHGIVTGIARGGEYGGTYDDVPEPYRDAIRRSNIRPEYARLAYANRYNYPSAFVLRSLVQGGELSQADGHQVLLDSGWEPTLAGKVAKAWGTGVAVAVDPHVKKAQTTEWTTVQRSYIAQEITAQDATPTFQALAVPVDAQVQVLASWDRVRSLTRKQLSPAQVKKAFVQHEPLPGGGPAQFATEQWAIGQLVERGYSTEDATLYLHQ